MSGSNVVGGAGAGEGSSKKPFKSSTDGVKPNWNPKFLQRDVLDAVLNGTSPTWCQATEGQKVLDIGKTVSTIVVELTGAEVCPIPVMLECLRPLAQSESSDDINFLNKFFNREIPETPKLPFYKKQNGGLVLCDAAEAVLRRSRWNVNVKFWTVYPRKNSRRLPYFEVTFRLTYQARHHAHHLPAETGCFSGMDVHASASEVQFTWRRYGKLKDLIKQDAFLVHLQNLIFKEMYRLRDTKFCTRVCTKGTGKKQYKLLCGITCGQGATQCHKCSTETLLKAFF